MKAAITAIGGFVPEKVLTNHDLEKMVDTSDEWIKTRTGIEERRILSKDKATSDMCAMAVNELFEKAKVAPEEIELIIVATVTPDHFFPSTANLTAYKTGMVNAFGFDISAACSGFLYALETGAKFIESGRYKKVVVCGGDTMSTIVDYTDRNTCVIFGDGAGAVLLEPNDNHGIQDSVLYSDGIGHKYLYQKAGGSHMPATHESVDAGDHFLTQEGKAVFKYAVKNMADAACTLLERNGLVGDDVDFLAAHQANLRIIDATANRMGLDSEKVLVNIQKFGNTTAGTIPLLLRDFEHKFKQGDKIVLAAFGGGFTWGSTYITWAYDSDSQ